ncbi:MAG: cytochrome c biogenesis CcdA family protein [Bradyrhizobium sp.]|uniref:cytochrome c biogenesis CcdA family protein n=1 Tax=Bradyrhizobium sp. TaxID=376 RepID=UPI003D0F0B45
MDLDALKSTLEQAGLASVAVGFAAGFLFSFNPVALASIPVSLAYVTKAHETKRAVVFGSMFVLGMILTHVLLGLAAGLGGAWAQKLIGRQWGLLLGPLLILLGFVWAGWVRLPLPQIPIRARRAATSWGAFGLGGSFSVAVCPACTPALVVLLGVAAGIGSALFGVTLLLAFAIGRSIPVILGAWAIGWLEGLKGLRRSQRAFDIVGGIVLILSGLYMLNAYFFIIPELAG